MRRVDIFEEVVDAAVDKLCWKEVRSSQESGRGRRVGNVEALLNLGRNDSRLTLGFSEFGDDLGSGAFRTFLLRDSIVRTDNVQSVITR